jgi:antagonist of KipI
MSVVVLSAGFQTTVQDCGRIGFRKFGVGAAGALDSAALRTLNLLVGNEECAAGLEVVSGRVRLQFSDDRLIAWTGGDFDVRIEPLAIPRLHCARVSSGGMCEIFPKPGRAWLAISGGLDVPLSRGSRATDLRARFGGLDGRALRDGDKLPLGPESVMAIEIKKRISREIADWSGPAFLSREKSDAAGETDTFLNRGKRIASTLRIICGKNWTDDTGAKLLASNFRVAMDSDRMGLRLEGAEIRSDDDRELVSQPVTPGTIQLPRGGAPIVLLADCQTIGGYPKLAHVISVDLAPAAQLQPMDEVRFELTTLDQAQRLLQNRESDIALFRAGLKARFG